MRSIFTILSAYCDENALHISLDGVHFFATVKGEVIDSDVTELDQADVS